MSKSKAARKLYAGARIFSLVSTQLDQNHKSKDRENRIEIPVNVHTTKCTVVNEVKLQHGVGGTPNLIVNGGDNKIVVPENYQFGEDKKEYKKDETGAPVYFADYKAAKDFANAGNEAELIRITIIRDELNQSIAALKTAIKANEDAVAIYIDEEE